MSIVPVTVTLLFSASTVTVSTPSTSCSFFFTLCAQLGQWRGTVNATSLLVGGGGSSLHMHPLPAAGGGAWAELEDPFPMCSSSQRRPDWCLRQEQDSSFLDEGRHIFSGRRVPCLCNGPRVSFQGGREADREILD